MLRLVLIGLVVAACGNAAHIEDAGLPETDASDGVIDPDASDAAIDAGIDATVPDTFPPSLASMMPAQGSATWLHDPIRLAFNEPLDPASVVATTVTAQVGGAAISAQLVFEAPSTVIVKLDPAARGVGTLAIAVSATIKDLAGNSIASPIDVSLLAPAWSSVPIDRGVATSAPKLAIANAGAVVAAWTVGAIGAQRVVVSELVHGEWYALGGELGASDVTSFSITMIDGEPLVAWSAAGQAHVARWTGSWSELTSPGAGTHVALVTAANGSPIVAVFGASVAVSTLVSDTWQAIGSALPIADPIVGEPMLTAAGDKPVLGWIDTTTALRVYRCDASWTAIAPISVSSGSRLSLAARGTTIAVAWDQRAGSFGVLAAQVTGAATTWTRLGRVLDIDIAGDAVAPAIALDASGAPIVAWTELVETKQRGALARWSGSTWTIVGGVSWLGDLATPARTSLALHAGQSAVVATSAGGSVRIARFNGPHTAALGISTRASIAGCAFSAANPPAALSQTGCFSVTVAGKPMPHAGLVPFDVVSELWSDGAKKRRWIALPDGAALTATANGSWDAPAGSIMIKEFALEMTPGNPATRRAIETRFLVHDAQLGWEGFSYRWNAAGTDASLQTDGQYIHDWPLDTGGTHAHVYPSRAHCRSCHHASQGPLLGLRPEQLARWFDYDGVIADQLATLAGLGVGPLSAAQPMISPHEPATSWEQRARGYMAANCAHCHNPQYLSIKDLRYTTPLASTRLCETIVPGSPTSSRVYQLVTTRPGMPALGTVAVDPLAEQLLASWISAMTACP